MSNKTIGLASIVISVLINGCAHVSTDVKTANYSEISKISESEKISIQTRTIILPGYYGDYSKKDQERYVRMNDKSPGFRDETNKNLITPLENLKNDNVIIDSAAQNENKLKIFKFGDYTAKEIKIDTSKEETLYLLISRLEYKEGASFRTTKTITSNGVYNGFSINEHLESKATFALYNKLNDKILYQADVIASTNDFSVDKWPLLSKYIGNSIADTLQSIRLKMKRQN